MSTSVGSQCAMGSADPSEILKQLNKKVLDSLIRSRSENGFTSKYIPCLLNKQELDSQTKVPIPQGVVCSSQGSFLARFPAQTMISVEWSGKVRSITYSADAKSVSVIYHITLYGTDAEIFRESIGTASVDDTSYEDPVQKAGAMAISRACAHFGLGLYLYHEDLS